MDKNVLLRIIADLQKRADKIPERERHIREYEKYVIAREMLDAFAIEMEQDMPEVSRALTHLVNTFMKA